MHRYMKDNMTNYNCLNIELKQVLIQQTKDLDLEAVWIVSENFVKSFGSFILKFVFVYI